MAELPNYEGKCCFETLTYDNEHLPLIQMQPTLEKEAIQLYHKRLRKKINTKFKYFVGAEYGEQNTIRPHYHIIYAGLTKKNHAQAIQDAWGKGTVYHCPVEEGAIRYTTSYIMDKNNPIFYAPREAPFQLSSANFGKDYLFENIDEIIELGYIQLQSGKKLAIPKYIKEYYSYAMEEKSPMKNRLKRIQNHKGWSEKDIKVKEINERDAVKSQLEWKARNQPRQSI